MRAEDEQLSSFPRHSGQKTIQRCVPKSRGAESTGRYIRRGGSVGGMWRRRVRGEVLDVTISRVPRAWSPERKFGERKGFRHFLEACWSGDMVSISPPSFGGVRARTPPKTQKQWNQGQRVTTRLVNIQASSGDSLNAWMFVHSF